MEYRIHPKTGDRISVIGIGTGPIFEAPETAPFSRRRRKKRSPRWLTRMSRGSTTRTLQLPGRRHSATRGWRLLP